MPQKLTIADFAGRVKAKYPEYANLDNIDLTRRIVAKYPEYKDALDVDLPMEPLKGEDPKVPLATRAGEAVLNFVEKEGPKIGGAAIGGAIGAPAGPAGILAGASLGAAGGEGLRQIADQLRGTDKADLGKINQAFIEGPMQEAGGAVAAKFPDVAATLLTKSAVGSEKQLGRVLAPTTNANKELTSKVLPRLAREQVVALTENQLAATVAGRRVAAGKAVSDAFAAIPSGVKLKTGPLITALDKARQEFVVNGVDVLPTATAKLDELKSVIQQFGPSVSPESLRKTRQIWDTIVSQSGGFAGKDLKAASEVSAQREIANIIRRQINYAFPDIRKVNADFSFWANVDDILQAKIQREAGRSLSMTDLISGGTGIAAAALQGNPLYALLPLIVRTMQSTAWRTWSASKKQQLAFLVQSGKFREATAFVGRLAGSQLVPN